MLLRIVLGLVLVFSTLEICICSSDDLEYEYDEDASQEVDDKGGAGIRLIGASRADSDALPWVVGYSPIQTPRDTALCTGSLISPNWILSAAHCITMLIKAKDLESCADITAEGSTYYTISFEIKCYPLLNGNYKLVVGSPGYAYLGISDITKNVDEGQKILTDYIVRHSKSYHGGGRYGEYGGYDITLIHLSKPAKFSPVCLPGPHYRDTGYGKGYNNTNRADLAGFGLFKRKPCITDDHGPSKYHYCKDTKCYSSPAPRHRFCEIFFNSPEAPVDVPEGDTELVLLTERNKQVYCYPRKSRGVGSKGWCQVENDVSKIGEEEEVRGWGFCGKECYLHERYSDDPLSDVLRRKTDVNILDDELCKFYLKKSMVKDIEVVPEIICVGKMKSLKYTLWKKKKGIFVKLDPKKIGFRHRLMDDKILDERNVYIHSAGTCNGDSGGPVYTFDKSNYKYVVLGVVSGGRGVLGKCGGMNNPTHYVRAKKFTRWIQEILATTGDKICVVEN